MRQTLLRIPIDGPWSLGPWEVPGFGFGLVLLFWVLFGAVWLYRHRRELAAPGTLAVPVAMWIAVAVAVVLLPRVVQRKADAAIAHADQILAKDPRSVEALLVRAQGRFSKREYAPAVVDLQAARQDRTGQRARHSIAWPGFRRPAPRPRSATATWRSKTQRKPASSRSPGIPSIWRHWRRPLRSRESFRKPSNSSAAPCGWFPGRKTPP